MTTTTRRRSAIWSDVSNQATNEYLSNVICYNMFPDTTKIDLSAVRYNEETRTFMAITTCQQPCFIKSCLHNHKTSCHKKATQTYYVSVQNITCWCFHSTCRATSKVHKKVQRSDLFTRDEHTQCSDIFTNDQQHDDEDKKQYVYDVDPNVQYIDQDPNVADALCKHKGILIKSMMGTGKTEAVINYLQKYHQPSRILWLSTRIMYATQLEDRLKKTSSSNNDDEFHSYVDYVYGRSKHKDRDTLQEMRDTKKLIVSLESISHLEDPNGHINHYDVVIVDEISEIISQIPSSTLKNKRPQTLLILQQVMRNAGKVIGACADISQQLGTTFLEKLCGPAFEFAYILNNRATLNLTYHMYENKTAEWYQQIAQDLKRRLKLYIYCSTKSEAECVFQFISNVSVTQFPDRKVKLITQDTDDTIKRKCTTESFYKELDVMITSPVIGVGISIDKPHFDVVYAYTSNSLFCSTVRTSFQHIHRVRHVTENKVHLCIKTAVYEKLPEDIETIKSNLCSNISKALGQDNQLHFNIQNETNKIQLDTDVFYNWLYCINVQERNRSCNHFVDIMKQKIKETGGTYQEVQKKENRPKEVLVLKETKESIKIGKGVIKRKRCQDISAAIVPESKEEQHRVQKRVKSGVASSIDKSIVAKLDLMETFRIENDSITPQFVEKMQQSVSHLQNIQAVRHGLDRAQQEMITSREENKEMFEHSYHTPLLIQNTEVLLRMLGVVDGQGQGSLNIILKSDKDIHIDMQDLVKRYSVETYRHKAEQELMQMDIWPPETCETTIDFIKKLAQVTRKLLKNNFKIFLSSNRKREKKKNKVTDKNVRRDIIVGYTISNRHWKDVQFDRLGFVVVDI